MNTKGVILIIDDEPDLREMLQFKFEAEGYTVDVASNGLEGLEKLKTMTPDLIILDMNMPKMGGLEFYNKICDNSLKPRYPVLVLTARANLENLFKELAIDGFMTKPFDIDLLAKDVQSIIIKHQRIAKIDRTGIKAGVSRHVLIAEDDQVVLNRMAIAFLNAGYKVNSASTGTDAIERACGDVPDFALIKLGLRDIAGDVVIARLRHMAKTSNVGFVLFTSRKDSHSRPVMEKLAEKSPVFIEYSEPEELQAAVDKAIEQKEKNV